MTVLCNSLERTVTQFDPVLRRAGWRISAVHLQVGNNSTLVSSIEAVLIF